MKDANVAEEQKITHTTIEKKVRLTTLLSQFDREAIEYACSEASKSSLSFLPILSEGEAILAGVDFPVPIIIKIDEPKNKPDSSTPLVV